MSDESRATPPESEATKRLRRVEGHLKSVIHMLEAGRDGEAVAQQLLAVERATCQARRVLIQDHIAHGLDAGASLDTLKRLAKYL